MSNTNVEALKALCKKITNYDSSGLTITEVIDDIESHYNGGATLSEMKKITTTSEFPLDSSLFSSDSHIYYYTFGNLVIVQEINLQLKVAIGPTLSKNITNGLPEDFIPELHNYAITIHGGQYKSSSDPTLLSVTLEHRTNGLALSCGHTIGAFTLMMFPTYVFVKKISN